jgi:hypothetical protein
MENSKKIISLIEDYLQKNPNTTFCQALNHLKINENDNSHNRDIEDNYMLRDNFYDTDEQVLERIKNLK